MKGILEFNLPMDEDQMKLAQRGGEFYCIILEIRRIIRDHNKYEKPLEECWKAIEEEVYDANVEDIS